MFDMAEEKQGWSSLLFLICVAVTIGAVVPIGYSFGVVNSPAAFIKIWIIQSIKSQYHTDLTDTQLTMVWALVISFFQIGGIIGSLGASFANKRFGRRGVLLVSEQCFILAAVLQFSCRFCNSVEMLMLGRFLGGVASAFVFSTQPMYLVELAPSELSGSVGVFTGIGVTAGIVLGQIFSFDFVLGNENYWHWALAGNTIFVLLGLFPLCLFPESPHYSMLNGNHARSKATLMTLRKSPERAEEEFAKNVAAAETQKEMSMRAVLLDSKLSMPIILVCSFHCVQQGSGCNAVFYYSVDIFTRAGFSLTMAIWLNFFEGLLNFSCTLMNPILVAKVNRRILMMISCATSGIFMGLLSIGLSCMEYLQWISYLCIFFLSMYFVCFNLGLCSIPYFIGSEICLVPPRAAVMAFGSLTNWTSNLIIGLVFPILSKSIGAFAFLPFFFICMYGLLITCRFLPETRNKHPEDVAPLLEHGCRSKIKPEIAM